MILFNKMLLLIFIGVISCTFRIKGQENLMNYENSLKFIKYLTASGQYQFASEELERLHFSFPLDTIVTLQLIQNYRLGNQCDKFKQAFEELSKEGKLFKSPYFSREYLKFALRCKFIDQLFYKTASILPPGEQSFYVSGSFWINSQFDSLLTSQRIKPELITKDYPEMNKLINEFRNIHYKKPGLALAMSGIIPGSGKAYLNRWGDAMISFVFVGANAYASYRAFHKKGINSVNGWIFGGLAISFYSGNLYGSFKAARKYNSELKSKYRENAEKIIYNYF